MIVNSVGFEESQKKKVRELRICLLPQALLIHFIIFELFQIIDFSPVDDIRQLDMFIL